MELRFRQAEQSDAYFLSWGFHTAMLMDDTEEELVRSFAETICSRNDVLYAPNNTIIAMCGEERVGMITAYNGKDYKAMRQRTFALLKELRGIEFPGMEDEAVEGEYYLDSLAVCKKYQGNGVGTALLKEAVTKGQKLGLAVTLAVDPVNTKAQRLYESLGFHRDKDIFIFGHTYWKMKLQQS